MLLILRPYSKYYCTCPPIFSSVQAAGELSKNADFRVPTPEELNMTVEGRTESSLVCQ
jgi:hypothetical protein